MVTKKQEIFIQGKVDGLNNVEAYKLAYNTANMASNTIKVKASELAHSGNVAVTIQERRRVIQAVAEDKFEIHAEEILRELINVGFSKMDSFARWGKAGVSLIESEELTSSQLAAVSEVSQTVTKDGGSIKFKLHDKLGALEKLGKYLGMFVDRSEVSVTHTIKPGLSLEELEDRMGRLEALEAGIIEGEIVDE